MKFKILAAIALLLFGIFFIRAYTASKPLLIVAIMIKDEEKVIQATLEPYLQADPQGQEIGYVIFDTGSTDATIKKVQELFERYHLTNFFIFQEPFIDFSTSRNRALDLVDECFPDVSFIIMPDAEWYIQNVPELLNYCKKEKNNSAFGPYFIRLVGPMLDFFVPRLIRQSLHSRFKGVVHEALIVQAEQVPYTKLPTEVFFKYEPGDYGREKSKKRYIRDRDLLLKEYAKNSDDTHTTFYLAQTYEFLDEWENAYHYYAIRTDQPGWAEDNFLAAYRKASAAEMLFKQNKKFSWQQVHDLYIQAFTMRSSRIEPLIKIAQHYIDENNMALAFIYAKAALDVPYPSDTGFVEKEMYHAQRYLIMGVAAWYLGYYDLGEWAIRKALEAHPDDERIKQNLQFYVHRKK